MLNTVTYERYRPLMKTGDVIAFSGKSAISKIIKWKTRSEFSHIGIVMDTDMTGIGKTVLLCESTSLINLSDEFTKEVIKGVQMHFLSQRLQNYDGYATWFPIDREIDNNRVIAMQAWLRNKHSSRTPYDTLQAMGAGMDLIDKLFKIENKEDLSSLFCSELVTKALQIACKVDKGINPSEVTPQDIIDFPCYTKGYRLT